MRRVNGKGSTFPWDRADCEAHRVRPKVALAVRGSTFPSCPPENAPKSRDVHVPARNPVKSRRR